MDHSKRKSVEARRVNVIYFLSRNGRIEHPHLIRIHHFCHSGVHLRDVKRWLSELRGKEMPDSFTWSYQRRYKKGFVWQDLGDDELITPISNHEYVLLGSLHPSASSSSPAELAAAAAANGESDFLPFSDQMDNSPEKEEPFVQDDITAAPQPPGDEPVPMEKVDDLGKSPAIICGGRSNSWRASHLLCNFLPCRAAETADSAVLDSSRRIVARRGGGGGGGGADHGPRGQVTQTAMSRRPLLRSRSSFGNTNSSENDGKVSFLIL